MGDTTFGRRVFVFGLVAVAAILAGMVLVQRGPAHADPDRASSRPMVVGAS